MKKRLFVTAMILIMVLTAAVGAYADTGVQPRDTAGIIFTTDRTSSTSASIMVDVTFTEVVDRYSVVVYLQKKVNGVWTDDTTNDDYVYYNNGGGSFSFIFSKNYTDLTSGGIYRIRCVSKDYIGSTSNTFTAYSNQF